MRLRSLIAVSVAGIAVLAIAALVALIVLKPPRLGVESPSSPAASAPTSTSPDAPAAPLAPAAAARAPEPVPSARGLGPPLRPWSAVSISARPSQLGAEVAAPIQRGLEAARDRMDPCFEQEARRARTAPPPAAQPGLGSPILTLSLESGAGTIAVVDAELDSLGHATAELVECCQLVLRGYVMPAPEAPPGERYRLRYVLQ